MPLPNGVNEILRAAYDSLEKLQATDQLPDFQSSEAIISVSDYSGEHAESQYSGYTFLIFDWLQSSQWIEARHQLRKGQLCTRSMEYKKMGDKVKLRALPQFLETFDLLHGIVVSFLVDKTLPNFLSVSTDAADLEDAGIGKWKPDIAEKIARVSQFQAILALLLTRNGQKFGWITDRDAITDDISGLGIIYEKTFNFFGCPQYRLFSYAKSFEDDLTTPNGFDGKEFDDFLALPDLLGGALCNSVDAILKPKGTPTEVPDKDASILNWMCGTKNQLHRYVFIIEPTKIRLVQLQERLQL